MSAANAAGALGAAMRAVVGAFSCFSTIPMPHTEWDERTMRYLVAAFPLVGAAAGACVWLWALACDTLALGSFARAVGLALVPLAVTGGIHMDGLADVVDAQSSHADPARKRQILKDPHVGAFAIMGIAGYLLAYCALASELGPDARALLCCVPVVSRCLSGLALMFAHPASDVGMMATLRSASARRPVCVVLGAALAATCGTMALVSALAAAALVLVAALVLAWVLRMATRDFGGMSGDLLGCYIQASELAMLACLVLVGRMG